MQKLKRLENVTDINAFVVIVIVSTDQINLMSLWSKVFRQQAHFEKIVIFNDILKSWSFEGFDKSADVLLLQDNSIVLQDGDEIDSQNTLIGNFALLYLTSHLSPYRHDDLVAFCTNG